MRNKIDVYARLKPKSSQKSKTHYTIQDCGKSNKKNLQKLTLSNLQANEKPNIQCEKIKSNINKLFLSNSEKYLAKMFLKMKFSTVWVQV